MQHLVRVILKDEIKIVQMFLGYFSSYEELETREPDDQEEASDFQITHYRLNDSESEARAYFKLMKKK